MTDVRRPAPNRPGRAVTAVLWAVVLAGLAMLVVDGVSLVAAGLVLYGALAVAAVTIHARWRGAGARFRRRLARVTFRR